MDARPQSYHTVIVIGAGISGLYAAQLLKRHLPDVLVVEASDRVGGRIQQAHNLAPWPIECGPEFVHGNKSTFTEVVKDFGLTFTEKPWPDWWYFAKEGRLTDDEGEEIEKLHQLFEDVGDEQPPAPGRDVSAEQWLTSKGATPKMLAVADACYANDFGCSLRQLGLREMIAENQRWDSGETYLIMAESMRAVIDRLATGLDIRLSCPITSITYDHTGAVLTGPGGVTLGARKVIITSSLGVLQAEKVAFSPALPQPKQTAIRRLRMGNAVKILVAFNERFWPEDMYDVVCSDSFVPEFWMTQHRVTDPACSHLHAVTGFIAGERADAVSRMPEQQALFLFLQQLDTIFGTPECPKPASRAYVRHTVYDWSKQPWVMGAYSFPSLGAEEGDRQALAAPVAGTLFWAGEATHEAVNPCMQAALETGRRAADQALAAIQAPTHSRL